MKAKAIMIAGMALMAPLADAQDSATCQPETASERIGSAGCQTFDEAFAAGEESEKAGKYGKAVRCFNEAQGITRQLRNISVCRWRIANCLWLQGKYQEAAPLFKNVYETPQGWDYLAWRARVREAFCYFYIGEYQRSLPLLLYAASEDNYVADGGRDLLEEAQIAVGDCLCRMKEYEKARKHYERLLASKRATERMRARILLKQGELAYALADYSLALKYFQECAAARGGQFDKALEESIQKCKMALKQKTERDASQCAQ